MPESSAVFSGLIIFVGLFVCFSSFFYFDKNSCLIFTMSALYMSVLWAVLSELNKCYVMSCLISC